MENITNKRVLVTGSQSMLGSQVVKNVIEQGGIVYPVIHKQCDLEEIQECCLLFKTIQPDYVIHCAGFNGGIEYNRKYPSSIFERSTKIGNNVLECSRIFNIRKIVSVLTSCAYPVTDILEEKNFLNGEPHPSVACHAYAKRHLFIYGKLLNEQYGLRHINVVFNNMYGPRDSFDPSKTKFIGGLIKKFVDAKHENKQEVELWGTGTPLREVIFSEDAGFYLVKSLIEYEDYNEVLNIGNGIEYSVKQYAEKIANIVDYRGKIVCNTEKPDGQMKKLLCNRKATKLFKYLDFTKIENGLEKTIDYYENIRK